MCASRPSRAEGDIHAAVRRGGVAPARRAPRGEEPAAEATATRPHASAIRAAAAAKGWTAPGAGARGHGHAAWGRGRSTSTLFPRAAAFTPIWTDDRGRLVAERPGPSARCKHCARWQARRSRCTSRRGPHRDELLGMRDGVLLARVTAPPVDGRANRRALSAGRASPVARAVERRGRAGRGLAREAPARRGHRRRAALRRALRGRSRDLSRDGDCELAAAAVRRATARRPSACSSSRLTSSSSPRARSAGGQVAARVVGRVARALRVGHLVDEHARRLRQLGRAVVARADLREPAHRARAALLLLRIDEVAERLGGRAGAGRVGKRVNAADPRRAHQVERVLKRGRDPRWESPTITSVVTFTPGTAARSARIASRYSAAV